MRSFGSDNNSGVHPQIMQAIVEANADHAIGYGDDKWTKTAEQAIANLLGDDRIIPLFTFNGTGANVTALQACLQPFSSIICPATAHIAVDECGAPTRFTGCPLKEVNTNNGKLTPELIKPLLHGFGFEHHSQPRVIAISQTTELGTVYTPDEIKALADLAHSHNMYLFVDGTRIANASATLGLSLREMTIDCGVDIFTLGGTKNGLMMGEAIIPLRSELAANMKYLRKQTTQLYSKMRYLTAQFIPYINEGIWLANAQKSNALAKKLAERMASNNHVTITQKVESNAVFFTMPKEMLGKLHEQYFFYDWNEELNEARLVCSWNTSDEDIDGFVSYIETISYNN